MSTAPAQRAGTIKRAIKWVAPACGLVLGGLWLVSANSNEEGVVDPTTVLTAPVEIGEFIQEVIESGEVESSSNVEIRCEVDTGSDGIAILEIIPEGTYVEEGDFLVRLDDAERKERLVIRQIDVNGSRAQLAQAKADLQKAKLELEEYKSGTFREQEEQMESEEFVAKENLRRAQEYLRYSQSLAEKGYVSEVQLEADRFAVEKATKELDVSRTKLEVLRTFTREKMLTQLAAAVETSTAKLASAERAYAIDHEQMLEEEDQIRKCVIHAPTAGQVVYVNKATLSGEPLIEEGKSVIERQQIIRLPDPKRMQVQAEVNESRIDLIEEGMDVDIKLDALPGVELTGKLTKVTEYPLPRKNSYVAHIKNYGATIMILDPPEGLRPGMTAEVAIMVQKREHATKVPVPAVFERESRYFCLVKEGESPLAAREIEIGAANEKYVLIEAGLDANEQVVLSPDTFLESIELPDPAELAARKAADKRLAAK
ncbi:MAG: efflux RND transporter periplasmic adaptor subunit [Verrucomicrobiota bacterium]